MTLSVFWPLTLPLPTVEGYSVQPGDAMIRSTMESGPARQRRRYDQVPTVVTVSWAMRQDQFAIFQAWYILKAEEGAAWFSINLSTGTGLVEHEARFLEQFSATFLGADMWRITSSLEVREQPHMSEESLNFLMYENPRTLISAITSFNFLIHKSFPATLK